MKAGEYYNERRASLRISLKRPGTRNTRNSWRLEEESGGEHLDVVRGGFVAISVHEEKTKELFFSRARWKILSSETSSSANEPHTSATDCGGRRRIFPTSHKRYETLSIFSRIFLLNELVFLFLKSVKTLQALF